MIGSENGRSADTYAETSRREESPRPQLATTTATSVTAHRVPCKWNRLLRAIREIVEHGHAVGPRPHLDRSPLPLHRPLAGAGDREGAGLKIDTQRVPLIRRALHVGALLLRAPTV